MIITVPKRDLLRIISRAASVADRKSTMPILASCMLVASGGRVEAFATDLTMYVASSAPCDVGIEGRVAIVAKDLLDRVKALPDGPVKIAVTERKATITAPGTTRRFQMSVLTGDEYPEIHGPDAEARGVSFKAADLSRLIGRVIHAANVDESRPGMNGVHLRWKGGIIRAGATDGARLAVFSADCNPEWAPSDVLIPLRAAAEIRAICDSMKTESGDDVVSLVLGDRSVWLVAPSATFGARLTDGAFPPIDKVIPKPKSRWTMISRAALLDAVKAAMISVDHAFGGVSLAFRDGAVTVKGETKDAASDAAEDVACDHSGPSITIGASARILVDALTAIDGEEIGLSYTGELDPVVIQAGTHTCVVMPMRML